jgi:hypothetical protein
MKCRGRDNVVAALAMTASSVACTTGVRASDVEQGCTDDAECVVVEELEQVGARCTVPCQKASIHRRVVDQYNRELARERRDCVTVTHLTCDPQELIATCRLGRCLAVPPSTEPDESASASYRSPWSSAERESRR